MKTLFLILYLVGILIVGIFASRKIKNQNDYYIAGRKGSLLLVTGSLLATILGASAVLGTVNLGFTQGWASSWLLLTASLGLFALYPIAGYVRRYGKITLPEMIGDFYGKQAKTLASIIIPFAWIGIVAAQMIGAAKILSSFYNLNYTEGVLIASSVFIFNTLIGGQMSVLRTDFVQIILILTGIGLVSLFLLSGSYGPALPPARTFPFNDHFSVLDLFVLIMIHSSTFFVGPDIYSRIFCARDEKTAKRSVLIAAIILIPVAFMLSYCGVYSHFMFPGLNIKTSSGLITLIEHTLPDWGIGVLTAALLAAVMSAAATTLLTSSIILSDVTSHGLQQEKSLRNTRIYVILVGIVSMFFALWVQSIIDALLTALTFFSGAFIIPTAAGIMGFRTTSGHSSRAILIGGLVAVAGKLIGIRLNLFYGNLIIISGFVINALLLFYPYKFGKNDITSKLAKPIETK